MAITPAQCRAAKGLLGWTQEMLSTKADVAHKTINQFELGRAAPSQKTLDKLRACFEKAGVAFIDENGGGAGVRLKRRD